MPDTPPSLRPVQVFLDTNQFIDLKKPKPFGGGKKDFFAGNNTAFQNHKSIIKQKIQSVASAIKSKGRAADFIHVELQEGALGKTYRPIRALFTEANGFAFVASGYVGQMIFQCTPEALENLAILIETKAEIEPVIKRSKKTGKLEKRPSAYRSELGGIADIELHSKADKVSFSAAEAHHWFNQNDVIGGYIVELFRPNFSSNSRAIRSVVGDFIQAMNAFDGGILVKPFLPQTNLTRSGTPSLAFTIQLLRDPKTRVITLPFSIEHQALETLEIQQKSVPLLKDSSIERHTKLLDFLAEQTLVRSVDLPPIIEFSPESSNAQLLQEDLPSPQLNANYPVVGVIDGGVAKCLDEWKAGEAGIVPLGDRDESHGTFIAGLISCGSKLNPHISPNLEPVGCKFYDIDMFPRKELRDSYYADADDFFDLLEEKIKVAKANGVRIFNLSFGMKNAREPLGYSIYADRLDRIAATNDVIFVVSAGNLSPNRPIWPSQASDAISMLATFNRPQEIVAPSEHLLGLTVGAINPPGIAAHTVDLPTTYTRRGPGVGGARKPDICHYGGVSSLLTPNNDTGLISVLPNGKIGHNCGTSFAAPNSAATLATLNHRLDGSIPRETLLALTVHRAERAKKLQTKALNHIARDFVGFGLSKIADELIVDDPHSISLIFNSFLSARKELEFSFVWPQSLVTASGGCKGRIDITLAYTPPIDPAHKEECQRVQLEAYLKQEDVEEVDGKEKISWVNQLAHDGSGRVQGMNTTERYLLMTGLKWSPIKRYYAGMQKGRGKSTNWKLVVQSLTRAGADFPTTGIPFSLIMTISDQKGKAPVHDEIRQSLSARNLQIADIQIANRIRQRR